MSTFVTVSTSNTASVLIPFTSAANAALAQAALDAGPNQLASLPGGLYKYFSPTVGGSVTVPTAPIGGGGVAQTNNLTDVYGLLPAAYTTLINGATPSASTPGGSGTAVAVGGAAATLYSGQNATTVYLNSNADGAAFLGGGKTVISNAFAFSSINISMDGGASGGLGSSTLIVDDHIGGGATVNANGGSLIQLNSGGSDMVIGNGGTVVVLAAPGTGSVHSAATVSSAGVGSTIWVGTQGAPLEIRPSGGDVFVFQGAPGVENAVTLFGGSGHSTVAGMNGFLRGGSGGNSLIQSGTTDGQATIFANGSGDVIFLQAFDNVADLGSGTNVVAVMDHSLVGRAAGDTFKFGAGSGQAFGGARGNNTFIFNGAGNYTVAGFHDLVAATTSAGFFKGSLYRDAATGVGGAGNITIADFVPQQFSGTVGGAVFDQFDIGGKTAAISSASLGGGLFNNTVVLSDGTSITLNNTLGAVHQVGTMIQ